MTVGRRGRPEAAAGQLDHGGRFGDPMPLGEGAAATVLASPRRADGSRIAGEGTGRGGGFRRRLARRSTVAGASAAGLLVVLTYVPFVFVVANSVKSEPQYAHDPLGIVFSLHSSNYIQAWSGIDRYLLNTVIVAAICCALAIPAAALSSYAFAEFDFPGKSVLFLAYLGLLMIPWTLTLIPLFLEIQAYHLYDTWWALILPYAAGSQPLMVFLFRTFFEGIPRELFESARIDGASEVRILARVVAPMSKPIFLTGAVILFINVWGDYLWPTIVLKNFHLQTASAGLEIFLNSFGYGQNGVGPEYAAYVITMAPVVLLVCLTMKYFVSGVTSGALKA